jgi:hypothetical protein
MAALLNVKPCCKSFKVRTFPSITTLVVSAMVMTYLSSYYNQYHGWIRTKAEWKAWTKGRTKTNHGHDIKVVFDES